MPKISIITPAYNCEKYLEQSVDSVLSQTWQDWELLIIDDCSKDNTYALMQKIAKKDKRIRILQNPQNSGAAATRNNGVRQAAGEWIAFIDSDDLWEPDKLEKQMALSAKNPEAAFVFTGSAFIDAQGNRIAHILHVPGKNQPQKTAGTKRHFLFVRSDPQRSDERISNAGRRRYSRRFCHMACYIEQDSVCIRCR